MQCKERVRLINRLLLCVLCLTICVPAVPVKADSDEDLKNLLDQAAGALSGDAEEARLSFVAGLVSALKSSGFSDAATAGALASMIGEGSFDPFIVEGGNSEHWKAYDIWKSNNESSTSVYTYTGSVPSTGRTSGGGYCWGGIGVIQWTLGRHKNFCDYSESVKNQRGMGGMTLNHVWVETREKKNGVWVPVTTHNSSFCGGPGAQTAFMVREIESGVWSHTSDRGGMPLSSFKALSGNTAADAVNAAKNACIAWTVCYEIPQDSYNSGVARSSRAEICYALVSNSDMASGDSPSYEGDVPVGGGSAVTVGGTTYSLAKYINIEQAEAIAIDLSSAGYWSEDDLAEYCRLTELNVDSILAEAKRENLNQREIEGLSQWERNVNDDLEKNGLASIIRRIVVFVGIIFLVWVVFVYLAYWFDRINTMFYIDLLGIMTLGHLHISDTEEECTFHAKDLGNGQRKTVNHRTILFICLAGIAFGVLIITGTYYSILRKLVNFIKRVIGTFM